jgi:23S rRNA (uracil1939-C5)-methyltransferase
VIEVHIDRIAAGGAGVGRLADGLAVFVHRTAPGDVAEVEIVRRRARHATGRVHRLVSPGPGRVAPACRHYDRDRCGGCQLQHLDAATQLAAKRRIVGDALRRIAKRDVADPEIVPSPAAWRYRVKLSLAAARGRIGLHELERPGRVFPLEDCTITADSLMAIWRRVRACGRLLPEGLTGLVLKVDGRGRAHVVVEGAAAGGDVWDAGPLARELGDAGLVIWWRPPGGVARVLAGEYDGVPPDTFAQVNPALAPRVRGDAVHALGPVAGRVVWDLYGGVGEAAERLAAAGATVWLVDSDPHAIAWAADRAGRSGLAIHSIAARAEEALRRLPDADVVLANPPRAGLHERVAAHLAAWGARRDARLVYVSCDPATLARDLHRMPSLALRSVTAYDLFPQTAHVETMAVLEGG